MAARRNLINGRVLLTQGLGFLFILAPLCALGQPGTDTSGRGQPAVPPSPFAHHAPAAVPNNRPYQVEVIVDLAADRVASVSLMFRTDVSKTYREVFLSGEYGRHRCLLPVEMLTGDTLTYFFLVAMKDYGLWAYPLGADGRIEPFAVALLPPEEYFRRR